MHILLYHGREKIGTVAVVKNGLFYKISCRFQLLCNKPIRLFAVSSGRYTDIGLCSQLGNEWGIEKWIAMKYLGDKIEKFYAVLESEYIELPVHDKKPFPMIDRLTDAFLVIEEGCSYIKCRK